MLKSNTWEATPSSGQVTAWTDDGPRLGSLNAEQTRAVQTQQAASGHDAAGSLVDGGDVALHCSLPHRVLQLVEPFDLQATELLDRLDGLVLSGSGPAASR